MDVKHKPGPWRVFGRGGHKSIIDTADKSIIAEMVINGDLAETKANARLIAAAPDLLAAAIAFDAYLFDADLSHLCDEPPRDALRAAIAKATGQTLTPNQT